MSEQSNAYGHQRAFYGRAKTDPKWIHEEHGTLKRIDGPNRIRMVGMGRYESVSKRRGSAFVTVTAVKSAGPLAVG